MDSDRKKKSKKYVSCIICLTLAIAVFPMTGRSASEKGSNVLDPLINASNPLPLDGQSLLDAAQSNDEKQKKSSKDSLSDHANSTSKKPASKAD